MNLFGRTCDAAMPLCRRKVSGLVLEVNVVS